MNKTKLLFVIAALAVCISATSAAEKGLIADTWWRITSGPGAGISFRGLGTIISDPDWGASGHIATGPECDCRHYHGTIFSVADDSEGCGWGCAEDMRYNPADALADLRNEIIGVSLIAPDLADKLDSILDGMDSAASMDCYSVMEALADAFEEEIYAYFGAFGDSTAFDSMFRALNEYVNLSEFEMDLGYSYMPAIKPATVALLRRFGSGSYSILRDAGPKVSVRTGSIVSLEGYGSDAQLYKWQYKWKGASPGENPTGCYFSFVGNHMTAMSQKNTQVRVTLWGINASRKQFKDSVLINFTPTNF